MTRLVLLPAVIGVLLVYQDQKASGEKSTFFKLVSRDGK